MLNVSEVVICGAGIAGISTAYYLATRYGITDVLIVDPHPPLSQTTSKSGENYRNWWPNNSMADFANRSIHLMEEIANQTENIIHMNRRGYLYVSTKPSKEHLLTIKQHAQAACKSWPLRWYPDRNRSVDRLYDPVPEDNYADQPLGVDILRGKDLIQEWYPHLDESIKTAIHVRSAGTISVHNLGNHMLQEAKSSGVNTLDGKVVDIKCTGQKAIHVFVEVMGKIHRVHCRSFVNAAGPFAGTVAKMLNIQLPIFSVFQQKVALQDFQRIIPRNSPFTIFMDHQHIPWPPQDQVLLANEPDYVWMLERLPGGIHIRPEGSGDSTWIKLGWAINRTVSSPEWMPKCTSGFPEVMLRGASRFVPELAAYADDLPQPVIQYGGYYTKTDDNLPLIGPMGIPGCYIVGALSGYGTMTACAAGELCASWVSESFLPNYAECFSPDRYNNALSRKTNPKGASSGEL